VPQQLDLLLIQPAGLGEAPTVTIFVRKPSVFQSFERSVEIAAPEVTGAGDLHVHAAIYAKRRFAVRSYSRADDATLFVYGSITAGSLTATEPRFRTQLNFDPRLEAARPPSFPVTDRYEITDWDGQWSVDTKLPREPR